MKWVSILGYISIWVILLPLLIGFIFYKRLNIDSKLILLIVIIGTVPQVLRLIINNSSLLNILYNLYTPAEFTVYWLLFRKKFLFPGRRKYINLTALLFILLSIIFLYSWGIQERFLNEWVIVNNIFQLSWICVCLLEYYYSEEPFISTSRPFFWFLFGITCYASCTAVFYSLWFFIKNNANHEFLIMNVIHHTFNILLYIFFSIGLLKNISPDKHTKFE